VKGDGFRCALAIVRATHRYALTRGRNDHRAAGAFLGKLAPFRYPVLACGLSGMRSMILLFNSIVVNPNVDIVIEAVVSKQDSVRDDLMN
jgi:hypothetical protein